MRTTAMATALALFACITLAGEFTGKVVGISDGDTITVLRNDVGGVARMKVRLAGIDAPESKQAHGSKAKLALSRKIHGKTVRVVHSKRDRYGRILGDVYLSGEWINLAMVSSGYAWH